MSTAELERLDIAREGQGIKFRGPRGSKDLDDSIARLRGVDLGRIYFQVQEPKREVTSVASIHVDAYPPY